MEVSETQGGSAMVKSSTATSETSMEKSAAVSGEMSTTKCETSSVSVEKSSVTSTDGVNGDGSDEEIIEEEEVEEEEEDQVEEVDEEEEEEEVEEIVVVKKIVKRKRKVDEESKGTKESKEVVETVKEAQKAVETAKEAPKPVETVKEAPKPVETVKEAPKPVETVKEAPKEAETVREAVETVKEVTKEPETVKEAPKEAETVKVAPKPVETVKEASKAQETVTEAPKPVETVKEVSKLTEAVQEAPKPVETVTEAPKTVTEEPKPVKEPPKAVEAARESPEVAREAPKEPSEVSEELPVDTPPTDPTRAPETERESTQSGSARLTDAQLQVAPPEVHESIKATINEIISEIDKEIEPKRRNMVPPLGRLRRTQSATNCTVVKCRGFKPSDRADPAKKEFLTALSRKIWHMDDIVESDNKENGPRVVDLQKIFTPATDTEEILPRQRKLYASSSFYSPTIHPTVEDQVALARRISHSLSDISNQHSKGQSMYVNRKKRSVKWVHEGEGKGLVKVFSSSVSHERHEESSHHSDNIPLKLVMNPRGQVQDLETLRKQGVLIEATPQSPDRCAEVVNALQATGGKGAELFAKRRKKSEKWIVDETSRLPPPAFTELGVQRAQQTFKINEIQEKYSQPRVKILKSPWQTALETGHVEEAFAGVPPPSSAPIVLPSESPKRSPASPQQLTRDLAYRPSVAQGWNAPRPHLPSGECPVTGEPAPVTLELSPTATDTEEYRTAPVRALIDTFERKTGIYTPPELPLSSYAPPPRVDLPARVELASPRRMMEPPMPVYAPPSPVYAPPTPVYAPPTPVYAPPKPVYKQAAQPRVASPVATHGASTSKWRNYNTAARGWRGADVYRPVTFEAPSQLPFTDF